MEKRYGLVFIFHHEQKNSCHQKKSTQSAWKLWHQTRIKDIDGIVCLSKKVGYPRAITANDHWQLTLALKLLSYSAVGAVWITLLVQGYKHIILIRTVRETTANIKYMREKHDSSKYAETVKFNWEIEYSGLCKRTWLVDCQQNGFACYILVGSFFADEHKMKLSNWGTSRPHCCSFVVLILLSTWDLLYNFSFSHPLVTQKMAKSCLQKESIRT